SRRVTVRRCSLNTAIGSRKCRERNSSRQSTKMNSAAYARADPLLNGMPAKQRLLTFFSSAAFSLAQPIRQVHCSLSEHFFGDLVSTETFRDVSTLLDMTERWNAFCCRGACAKRLFT